MSKIILKKNGTDYLFGLIPIHYPGDRVYLDGDTTKTVQDKVARKADLTNLDLTGTTNTTGSTIASGTYFYLNGTLVRATTAIANGVTFTLNTNYEVVTAGGLNGLIKTYSFSATLDSNGSTGVPNLPDDLRFIIGATYSGSGYGIITVYSQVGRNKALNVKNTDGTPITGTHNFTIAYI